MNKQIEKVTVDLNAQLPAGTHVQVNGGEMIKIRQSDTVRGMICTMLTLQEGRVVLDNQIDPKTILSANYCEDQKLLSVFMKTELKLPNYIFVPLQFQKRG